MAVHQHAVDELVFERIRVLEDLDVVEKQADVHVKGVELDFKFRYWVGEDYGLFQGVSNWLNF